MLGIATEYLASGLCALPASARLKCPFDPVEQRPLAWRKYNSRRPTQIELDYWFSAAADGIFLVCGAVSGNLEMIDFDFGGQLFDAWAALIPGELLARLVIERSQSGGRHVVYRCSEGVEDGNLKLARRRIVCDSASPIMVGGKPLTPRATAEGYIAIATMIETRGAGGGFVSAPTPGYEVVQGSLSKLPVISIADRQAMISAAIGLNEWVEQPPAPRVIVPGPGGGTRPGDDYCSRGDMREVLRGAGWTQISNGDNEHWCRPGKSRATSATLKNGVFYVFSTNAQPFEPDRGYSAFQVFALTRHGGDYVAAARALAGLGYGRQEYLGVDVSGIVARDRTQTATTVAIPPDLMQVPGLVGRTVEWNLATADRPQPTLALAGAICLQAALAARKIRDVRNNRTNLLCIGMAESSEGKGHARKIIRRVLESVGATVLEGASKLASDAGLISLMVEYPARIIQLDEFGRYLSTMTSAAKSPHLYGIVTTMMELYSEADGRYYDKAYADLKRNREVVEPCLVLHATSSSASLKQALTPDMMSDGSLARFLVFETSECPPLRDEATLEDVPADIARAARNWWQWRPPGAGNLDTLRAPGSLRVDQTDEARERYRTLAAMADSAIGDAMRGWQASVWGRCVEKARRLALVYAASRVADTIVDGELPIVDLAAADWGCRLAAHLTARLVAICEASVASSQFDAARLRLLQWIRDHGGRAERVRLLRASRLDARRFNDLIETMMLRGDVEAETSNQDGRGAPGTVFVVR